MSGLFFMIQIQNLTKVYDHKGLKALDSINAVIEEGELVSVIGPSGAGKSTLLRFIHQAESQSGGEITTSFGLDQRVLISQDWQLDSSLSLEQMLENEGKEIFKSIYPRFRHLVEVFRLQGKVTKSLESLSMGQKARAFLIKNLVRSPKLLLLDEPFAHLDRFLREEIEEELSELRKKENLTIVIVSHDLESALKYSDKVLFLSSGRLYFSGTPQDFFHRPPNNVCASFTGGANLIASTVKKVMGEYFVVHNPLGEFRVHQSGVSIEFRPGSHFAYLFCRSHEIKLQLGARDFKIKATRFKGASTDLVLVNQAESVTLHVTVSSDQNLEFQEHQLVGVDFGSVRWQILPI